MSNTKLLQDLVKVQRDMFALTQEHEALCEGPLRKHTDKALAGITELYNASLVEAMKKLPNVEAKKLVEILQPHVQ